VTINKASGSDTFSGDIQGAQGFIKSGAGTLVLSAANTYTGGTTISGGTLYLNGGSVVGNIANNGNLSIRSDLVNVVSGTGSLTKEGSGIAALWNPNTYTGATVINAGQLMLAGSGAISSASEVQIASGASMRLDGYYAPANINRTIGGLTGAGVLYSSGGTVTVNKTSGINTFSGDIQGGQGLIKDGAGTLVLSSANTYTGGTTISGGTLDLNGGSVSGNITNNANLVIRSDLVNAVSGTGSLTKEGLGDAYLWTASSYTGATVINGGKLVLAGAGAIAESSAVQIASGGILDLAGPYAPNNINRTIGGLSGGGIIYASGGTVTVNKVSGTDIFTGNIQGGQGLIKSGAGTLALGGASTYTGDTTVSAGILLLANGSGLGSTTGGTTVASGAVLRLTNNISVGNEALTISGQGAGTGGGALRSVGGANTWQGKVTLAAASTIGAASGASLTLDVASGNAIEGNNRNLTFDGAGAISVKDAISLGTGGLTKAGSGTTTLEAANSYSGGTSINEGRIVLSGSGRLGSGAITVVNSNNGTLELAVTGINVMGNAISGDGALLSSSGETRFTGAVTSTGGLTVNSSTVRVGNSGSVATATTINNGGTLDVAGTAGIVQLNSGGTLKGSGTISALTIASGGTLSPGNSPGTLTASSATWNGGGTYAWEINNFLGSAGSNWDFLNVTGGLTINASSGNKFIIDVISLLASNNTAGDASNFNAWSNYTFAIATAAGGISGFDSSYFDVKSTKFSNSMLPSGATGAGSWSVSQVGNSINLNYAAAIPEPSSLSLVVLGLATVLAKRRRKSGATQIF
ncbi:MAG: PEP-CTERM sorting domain-containing protein, partial [Verrucomicrobia bacterium]|nr:PEP-CTERM sorting domain-containing protein [Verrucomicrobiota bacterium]